MCNGKCGGNCGTARADAQAPANNPDEKISISLMIKLLEQRTKFLILAQNILTYADKGYSGNDETILLKTFASYSPEERAALRLKIDGRLQEVGRMTRTLQQGAETDNLTELISNT